MAVLAVQSNDSPESRDLFDGFTMQVEQLWRLRLQRLAMLRQARQREELESAWVRAEAELLIDPLTGLGNRRRFDEFIAGADLPDPTTLLVIDVDHFKLVNDRFSHSVGDQILCDIATILRAHCRAVDVPIRYAGDEFVVFLQSDLETGRQVAERIRRAVADHDFRHITPGERISISTGVAEMRPGMTVAELFHRADARLLHAKRHGRDQVAV
jgi:diguanylate cyclase